MKTQLNEIKRMQRLAGLITESEYQKSLMSENFKVGDKAKINKNVTRFDSEAHDFFVGDIGTIVAIDKEKQRAQFKKKNGSTFSIALKALDLSESQFLSEAKYFTKFDDVKKEITANKGAVAIFKVEPEDKSAVSNELKPHLGKLVSVEGGKDDGSMFKVTTLNTYKEDGDKFQKESEVIKDLGEGGDLSFLKLYAIAGASDNAKKIKKQDGSGFEDNPNYDPNKLSIFPTVKKY